jgi:hypothetical protein
MAENDGEQQSAPQDTDGVVVATLAAGLAKGNEELAIGDGFEDGADGLQGGRIVEGVPGEEGFGDGDDHGELRGRRGQ